MGRTVQQMPASNILVIGLAASEYLKRVRDFITGNETVGDVCDHINLVLTPALMISLSILLISKSNLIDNNLITCRPVPEWVNIPKDYVEARCQIQTLYQMGRKVYRNHDFNFDYQSEISGGVMDSEVPFLYIYRFLPAFIGCCYLLLNYLTTFPFLSPCSKSKFRIFIKVLSLKIESVLEEVYLEIINKESLDVMHNEKLRNLLINIDLMPLKDISNRIALRKVVVNSVNLLTLITFMYHSFGKSEFFESIGLKYTGFLQKDVSCFLTLFPQTNRLEMDNTVSLLRNIDQFESAQSQRIECIVPPYLWLNMTVNCLMLILIANIFVQVYRMINICQRKLISRKKSMPTNLHIILSGQIPFHKIRTFIEIYEKFQSTRWNPITVPL